jgi:Ferritin-like domain
VTDETPVEAAHPGGPTGVSRRSLLVAASAALPVLLAGCKGVQALGTPPPPPREIRVLRAAITAEQLMVARYSAALTRLPASSAGVLAAVRAVQAEHAAHLGELRSRLIEPAGAPTPAAARAPALAAGSNPSSVLAGLEQAEQAASNQLLGQLAVLPPTLAQLFASVAASEATHVPFLQQAQAAAG